MAFVSVKDPTDPNSPVTGIFNVPQNYPFPPGYIGYMPETDPRYVAFIAATTATPAPTQSPS